MTLINIRNLGVTLGVALFSRLNLVVNAGDRIGLVAANGRGKSTLLRCMAGAVEASEGEIARSRGLTNWRISASLRVCKKSWRFAAGRASSLTYQLPASSRRSSL